MTDKGDKIFFERYKRVRDEVELCVGNTETGEVKVLFTRWINPILIIICVISFS